jgi:hypothetical protein
MSVWLRFIMNGVSFIFTWFTRFFSLVGTFIGFLIFYTFSCRLYDRVGWMADFWAGLV